MYARKVKRKASENEQKERDTEKNECLENNTNIEFN